MMIHKRRLTNDAIEAKFRSYGDGVQQEILKFDLKVRSIRSPCMLKRVLTPSHAHESILT